MVFKSFVLFLYSLTLIQFLLLRLFEEINRVPTIYFACKSLRKYAILAAKSIRLLKNAKKSTTKYDKI